MTTQSLLTLDPRRLSEWVGRTEQREEVLDSGPAVRMAATLDIDDVRLGMGDPLPPLWHWIYFLSAAHRRTLGRDGHPRPGVTLPPIALERRMWAGGSLAFSGELRIGDVATRQSTITGVQLKEGRSGQLCFVTLRHVISVRGKSILVEDQDIVYRPDATAGSVQKVATPEPEDADKTQLFVPDSTLLFRYSALTFNGHRIHYDRDYARNTEGYDGLVVHGPLIATILLQAARRSQPQGRLRSFGFRSLAPLFDNEPFRIGVKGSGVRLSAWAANSRGELCMSSTVEVEA